MTATVRNASIIQRLYNWTMEKSAHPHAEYWLALVAFVEASFFPIPPHPLLGLTQRASGSNSLGYVSYGTEAGYYQRAGIPAIVCGPGDIAQAHQPEEWVAESQIAACCGFLGRLIESQGRRG